MHPAPFETLVAPARARPELWRVALGLVLAVAGQFAGVVAALALAGAVGASAGGPGRTPAGLILLLMGFAGLAAGTVLAARLLHRRAAAGLIGPPRRAAADFLVGAGLVAAVYVGAALAFPALAAGVPHTPPALWALWLVPALLGVLVQTGAEELAFRGYLQSQLAARFRSPLAWAVAPSALFGLVHWDPATFGANAPLVVAATALFGLIAADLTARSGSLGLAWGLHFANNIAALLVLAPAGPLDALALRRMPFAPDDPAAMAPRLLADMAQLVTVWALARLMLARRGRGAGPGTGGRAPGQADCIPPPSALSAPSEPPPAKGPGR